MAEVLDKFAAGELIRKRREERGFTQEQVVEGTSIPVAAYLSELENGKVNIARSKHFASLAVFLRLSDDDIRAINPAAVFNLQPTTNTDPPGFPAAPFEQDDEIYMPQALQDAIDKFGDEPEYAGLRDPEIQRQLFMLRRLKGAPQTPGEWLALYAMNRRWLEGRD